MAAHVETSPDYVRRLLGYVEGKDALSVLATTAIRLRTIVQDTSLATLRRSPAPDRWSAAQIMAHLSDAEMVIGYRFRLILAHDGVDLQAYDQEEWARNLRYEATDPLESVELFEAARNGTLRLLRRVDPKRHDNFGMHPERGRETVAHLIRLTAGHDLNHLGQIEGLIGSAR